MNKNGSVLIFIVLVITVLSILASAFFYKNVNESFLVQRHAEGTKALWNAEAGVAAAIRSLPNSPSSTDNYSVTTTHTAGLYYNVISTGTEGDVQRRLDVMVKTDDIDIDPDNFPNAIESTVELVIKGSVDILPDDSYAKSFSSINFSNLFTFSKDDVKSVATIYNSMPSTFSGVSWLEPPSLPYDWDLTSNLVGSGILIVEGDIHIAGTVDFDGIIYVIGELRMSGTPVINGAILAESSAELDTTLTGNVTVEHDRTAIENALNSLEDLMNFFDPEIVSWKEVSIN